jgi:excisionase family DNA binding protein
MIEKLLVSVEEAARILSLGRNKMFDLVREGDIESLKVGRRRLIPREALSDFVERQRGQHRNDSRG